MNFKIHLFQCFNWENIFPPHKKIKKNTVPEGRSALLHLQVPPAWRDGRTSVRSTPATENISSKQNEQQTLKNQRKKRIWLQLLKLTYFETANIYFWKITTICLWLREICKRTGPSSKPWTNRPLHCCMRCSIWITCRGHFRRSVEVRCLLFCDLKRIKRYNMI